MCKSGIEMSDTSGKTKSLSLLNSSSGSADTYLYDIIIYNIQRVRRWMIKTYKLAGWY